MHTICSRTEIAALSAMLAHRDVVETPAILLEYFCYDINVLQRLSGHVETGEKFPAHYLDSVRKRKLWFSAIDLRWEIVLSTFDLRVHAEEVPADISQLLLDLMKDLLGYDQPCRSYPHCSFPQIMGGYGGYEAVYYGYVLSRAYAVQMFHSRFAANPLEPQTGKAFRENYLQHGCFKNGKSMIIAFTNKPFSIHDLHNEIMYN